MSDQLPIEKETSGQGVTKTPDQAQQQTHSSQVGVNADLTNNEGISKSKKKKNKKKKKKKNGANAAVEDTAADIANDETVEDVAIESSDVSPGKVADLEETVKPIQEPIVEEKLEKTIQKDADVIQDTAQEHQEAHNITEPTELIPENASQIVVEPNPVDQVVVNAALSETVEDIKKELPDEKVETSEPTEEVIATSKPEDQAPVEAALSETIDEIKESVPEEVLKPTDSLQTEHSKEQEQAPVHSEPIVPVEQVKEVEPTVEEGEAVKAAQVETVESIKETVPEEILAIEEPIQEQKEENPFESKEETPLPWESDANEIKSDTTQVSNDLFQTTNDQSSEPLPWEEPKPEQIKPADSVSLEQNASEPALNQAEELFVSNTEEQSLPWEEPKVEASAAESVQEKDDPFSRIDNDETLPLDDEQKPDVHEVPVQQTEVKTEEPAEQSQEDLFGDSKNEDFSALIGSQENTSNATPEPSVIPQPQQEPTAELFSSENDDFSALISGGTSNSGEKEQSVEPNSNGETGKPAKKFSFLELEMDDDLLDEDDLLPDEPQPQAQPQTVHQPAKQTNKYQNTQAYQQHQPNNYNPYAAQRPNQFTPGPSATTSHLDIKKLNETKKKSDAYDFPIDLISQQKPARAARALPQQQQVPQSPFAQPQQSVVSPPPFSHGGRTPQATPPVGPPRATTPAGSGLSATGSVPSKPPVMKKKQSSFFEELPIPLPVSAPAKAPRRASHASSVDSGFNPAQPPAPYPNFQAAQPPHNPYAAAAKPQGPPKMPAAANRYSKPSSPLINQASPALSQNRYAVPAQPIHQHQQFGQPSPQQFGTPTVQPSLNTPSLNTPSYAPNPLVNQSPVVPPTAAAAGKPSKYTPSVQPQQPVPNLSNFTPAAIQAQRRSSSFGQQQGLMQPPGQGGVPQYQYQQPGQPQPQPGLGLTPGVPSYPPNNNLTPSYPNPPTLNTGITGHLSPSQTIISPSTPAASKYAPINHRRQASSTANQYDPYSLTKVQQQQQLQQHQQLLHQQQTQQLAPPQPHSQFPSQLPGSQPVQHQSLQAIVEKVVNPEQLLRRQFPLFSWGNGRKLTYFVPSNSYMGQNIKIVETEKVLQDIALKEFPAITKKNIPAIETFLDKQIESLSAGVSSQSEEYELLLAQILKSKLSKSGEVFNLGGAINYVEPVHSFNEKRAPLDGNKKLSKRQLVSLISYGQKEQALGLALSHQDYALALLISSVMNKDAWIKMVKEYLTREFSGDHDNFLSTLFQILSGDAKNVIEEFKSNPNKKSWALTNWKELTNAVLANAPLTSALFVTEFGQFLIENGEVLPGYILFIMGDAPITIFQTTKSVRFTLYLEIYGLILHERGITSDLSSVYLQHAYYLADYNLLAESQKYLDAATASFKASKSALNPKVEYSAKILSERLSGSGAVDGGWFARPKLDRVWGTLDKSLNKFIAGEETSGAGQKDGGVFSKFSPNVSRTSSYLSLQNVGQQAQAQGQAYPAGQRQPSQSIHRSSAYAPGAITHDSSGTPGVRAPIQHPTQPPSASFTPPSMRRPESKIELRANEPLKTAKPPLPSNPYAPVQNSTSGSPAPIGLSQPPKIGAHTPLSSRGSSPRASLAELYGNNSPSSRPSRYAPLKNEEASRRSSFNSNAGSVVNEPLNSNTGRSSPARTSNAYAPPPRPNPVHQQSYEHYPTSQQPTQDAYRPLENQSSVPVHPPPVSQIPSQVQSPQQAPARTHIPPPPISRQGSDFPPSLPRANSFGAALAPQVPAPPPKAPTSVPPPPKTDAIQPQSSFTPPSYPVTTSNEPVSSIEPEQELAEIRPEVLGEQIQEEATDAIESYGEEPKEHFPGEEALDTQVAVAAEVSEITEPYNESAPSQAIEKEFAENPADDFDPEGGFNQQNRVDSEDFDVGPSAVTQYESPEAKADYEEPEAKLEETSVGEEKLAEELSFNAAPSFQPPQPVNPYAPPQATGSDSRANSNPYAPPANPYAPPQAEPSNEETNGAEVPASGPPKFASPYAPSKSSSPASQSKRSASANRFTPRSYTPSKAVHEPENIEVSGDVDFYAFEGGYQPPEPPVAQAALKPVVTDAAESKPEEEPKPLSPMVPPHAQQRRESNPQNAYAPPRRESLPKNSYSPSPAAPNPYAPPVASNPYAPSGPSTIPTPAESKFSPYQPNGSSGQSFDGLSSGAPTLNAQKPSQFAPFQPGSGSVNASISSTYEPPSAKFTSYEPPKTNDISDIPEDDEYYDDVVEDEDDDDDDDDEISTKKSDKKERKASISKKDKEQSGGWFGWLRKDNKNEPKVYRAKLGDENRLIYDEKLKRWIDKDAKPEDIAAAAAPPPPPIIKKKPSSISKPRSDSVSDGASIKSPIAPPTPSFPTPGPGGPAPPSTGGLPPPSGKATPVAGDLDSLLGLSGAGGSTAAASTRRKKRGGRGYVDVMGSMQQKK